MASQALYLKWRPLDFDEVVGQEHVTYTLRNALTTERVGHAYLFAGPRGTGKTTMARLLAKAVNCLHEDPSARPDNECDHCIAVNEGRFLDLIEIDAASHTGVDDVRELRERIAFSPNEGQYKIYIIDEVHRFSGNAFDALLKTIEEPPPHAIFVLATTEIHKVPQTILSRCQRFDFRRIPLDQIVEHLAALVEAEGVKADPAALELIARQATGSLRDAISLLDQLVTGPEDYLDLERAQVILGTVAEQSVRDLTGAMLDGDAAAGLDLINSILDEGADPRQFAHQMVDYLRLVMLAQTGGLRVMETLASPDTVDIVLAQAESYPRRALLDSLNHFNRASNEAGAGWQPQLPLELALVESIDALYPAPVPGQQVAPAQQTTQAEATPSAQADFNSDEQDDEEAEPEPDPLPAADAPTVEAVRQHWKEVQRQARGLDLSVEALLNTASIYGVDGYAIVLQMPSELLRDKIEMDQNRQMVEQVFQQVFGMPLKVRCRVRAAGGKQSREVEDLIAQDNLAAFAVNELGGRVSSADTTDEE